MEESSVASVKHFCSVVENKPPQAESKAVPQKNQLLQNKRTCDSGYNSPVTPGSTPDNTTPSKAKSLHLGAQPQRSVSCPATVSTQGGMQRVVQSPPRNQLPPGKNGLVKQLSSPGVLDGAQKEFLHLGGVEYPPHTQQRMTLGQQKQPQLQQPPQLQQTSLGAGMTVLSLAYKCKDLNPLAWNDCRHPYCVMVRNNLAHMRTCYSGVGECKRCQVFDAQLFRHAEMCTSPDCPVDMCPNIKQQLQQEFGSLPYSINPLAPRPLQRSNSFGASDQYYGNSNPSGGFLSLNQMESGNFSEDSPIARYIGARADEILNKLEREEPLLPAETSSAAPSASLGRPSSLRANSSPNEDYQILNMLSPIAERSEDMSPSFGVPHLLGTQSMQSLSLMSSYEQDGINKPQSNTAPSMAGPNSMIMEGEDQTVFPEQKVMHPFTNDYLTVGSDGHYYQLRDYNANDNMISGGFGTVRFAEDLATNHLFAIKCNNRDDDTLIESMETEARLLSKLGPHINVIQMYGAVLDQEVNQFSPTRMYKLMMELSQHGNLAEMVTDPETKEPFPLDRDQGLFYFWQVLKGVEFLHRSNILHLDIKGSNILVFDEGRTLKICDFGTAVNVDEVASKVGKNLGTLQFSAPEICRQQVPHFSSDMWSTMCVLVEILTGQKPWSKFCNNMNSLIFKIGCYKNEQMETDLLPPDAELDEDIVDMMRLVFREECEDRASARMLLDHSLIVNAYTYEACFDEVLEEDDALPEDEDLCAPHGSCPPASLSLSLAQNNLLEEHISFSGCPIHSEGAAHFVDIKRLSKDSGTGAELMDQEVVGDYKRMSSYGRNSDSGLDTPYTADKQILSMGAKSMFTFCTCHEESSTELTDTDRGGIPDQSIPRPNLLPPFTPSEHFKSLPNPVLQSDPVVPVQRSFSLTLPDTSYPLRAQVGPNPVSQTQLQVHQYPYSYSRLRHSNSAPVIGGKRRLSLQSLNSYGQDESNGRLRRISSEIYVDRGPDIDSPDRVREWAQDIQKQFSLQMQGPEDHQGEYSHLATGHTHSEGNEPFTRVSSHQKEDMNCNHSHRSHQEEDTQACGGQGSSERTRMGFEHRTKVERCITEQGRTFETYKTVC